MEEIRQEIALLENEIATLNSEHEQVVAQLEAYSEDDTSEEKAELVQREQELTQEIVTKQMRIRALQRQLADLESNAAMANYNEEE